MQGCNPIAEGSIVGYHDGYLNAIMDAAGNTKRLNVSVTRSLIVISKLKFEHWLEDMVDDSEEESGRNPDAMDEIETDWISGVNEKSLPTRVLDDAFHFMDRLLRLLSQKHSAFKAFPHDFSESIFIRDKSDEAAVRPVLEKNGVNWEYAKRAKAKALNQRIRRYIPRRQVLLQRLQKLFNAYADMQCSIKKSRGAFFFDDAKKMVKHLLDTVRKGYLSDPGSCLFCS
ncbi:hypothetical protein B0H14DRAFT_3435675 [Mycena olivaceomarginata]|nr:hypothetical protein B0H14DRAFT_3435675 [Mycena olivaceomarginata]